jgi:hypothetical protein
LKHAGDTQRAVKTTPLAGLRARLFERIHFDMETLLKGLHFPKDAVYCGVPANDVNVLDPTVRQHLTDRADEHKRQLARYEQILSSLPEPVLNMKLNDICSMFYT